MIKSNNIKLGLVTASLRNSLNSTAPLEFLKIFDSIITGNDTNEGKLSPKPFLKAAKKLNQGDKCLVILPDSIRNYLTKFVDDKWMEEQGLLDTV